MGHPLLDETACIRRRARVLTIFGNRPEAVKITPVVHHLRRRNDRFHAVTVSTGQAQCLSSSFGDSFGLKIDHDLDGKDPRQASTGVFARVLTSLEPVLAENTPDAVLVQGDSTSAAAGAVAAFHASIPVGHVEAGIRSANPFRPAPEEMNRRLISRLATFHFAATGENRERLLVEGVPERQIFVTGSPLVESLSAILASGAGMMSAYLRDLLARTEGSRRLVVTSRRRENFGGRMADSFRVLRNFVQRHSDVSLIVPVEPNERVKALVRTHLLGHDRVHLIEPLGYGDFLGLLSKSWLIASDSSEVQQEAAALGKPLLILREDTERPESVESGIARLVADPAELAGQLDEAYPDDGWVSRVEGVANPFGDARSGERVADALERCLTETRSTETAAAVL